VRGVVFVHHSPFEGAASAAEGAGVAISNPFRAAGVG